MTADTITALLILIANMLALMLFAILFVTNGFHQAKPQSRKTQEDLPKSFLLLIPPAHARHLPRTLWEKGQLVSFQGRLAEVSILTDDTYTCQVLPLPRNHHTVQQFAVLYSQLNDKEREYADNIIFRPRTVQ